MGIGWKVSVQMYGCQLGPRRTHLQRMHILSDQPVRSSPLIAIVYRALTLVVDNMGGMHW